MTFLIVVNIIITIKNLKLDHFLDTFDIFIDDLISSDIDLLKSELDLLIMQHIFKSIDLDDLKNVKYINDDSFVA